jgi:uncharacterized membrane protein
MNSIKVVILSIFWIGIFAFLLSVISGNAMDFHPDLFSVVDTYGRFISLAVGYILCGYTIIWLYHNYQKLSVWVIPFVICLVFFFEVCGYLLVISLLINKQPLVPSNMKMSS